MLKSKSRPASGPRVDTRPSWLVQFERQKGRPLRVLHIGNIANNAYNNARIQRMHGIAADVMCHDYYHVMGTPEWEDAPIKGKIADAFYPDWWSVDLGDWQRPEWFVQGPRDLCLSLLWSRNSGEKRFAYIMAVSLVTEYWRMLEAREVDEGETRDGAPFDDENAGTSRKLSIGTPIATARALSWLTMSKGKPDPIAQLMAWVITRGGQGQVGDIQRRYLRKVVHVARLRVARGSFNPLDLLMSKSYDLARNALGWTPGIDPTKLADERRTAHSGPFHTIIGTARFLGRVVKWYTLSTLTRLALGRHSSPENETPEMLADRVARVHRRNFADLPAEAFAADVRLARDAGGGWSGVLGQYDIVQAYSTDGIIPLACGITDYIAYEHGTLREIPFEATTQGRLCRTSYTSAAKVLVTNTDVLPSVERLGIPPERVVYLPHAFNDSKLRAFRDAHPELSPPKDGVRIFSPTRHHWREGDGSWLKGNDVLLRAAARLAAEGRGFTLVLVEWGQEVAHSKALIDELGLAGHVRWVPTMTKAELWAAYCQSHAVVDQFVLPAIGGVGFETLALGRRLITRIDEPTLARFFGACPPIMNAGSVDEAEHCLRRILDDPDDKAGIGAAGRDWIRDYHSAERVVSLQLEAYGEIIAARERPSAPSSPS